MATRFQLTIDCADPAVMTRFWATALRYRPAPAPDGFSTWREYYLSIGVPEEELGDPSNDCCDRVVDPDGVAPALWFQCVPEPKAAKNRLHLDLLVGGGRSVPIDTRRRLVEAEAGRLEAAGARRIRVLDEDYLDHYGVVMQDPEGNEFCVV